MSRSPVVILGVTLLITLGDCASINDGTAPTGPTASPVNSPSVETALITPEFDLSVASGTRVTVVGVIDEDTIDIQYESDTVETVRLLGVDTPQTGVTQTNPDEWQRIPISATGRDWLANWGARASTYVIDRLANKEIIIIFDPVSDR